VTNDAALVAVAAAFFWRFFRALATPPRPLDAVWLGALAGVAFLAKPQGAFLAALIPIPFLAAGLRSRRLLRIGAISLVTIAVPVAIGIGGNLLWQGIALPGTSSNAPVPGPHGLRTYLATLTANHLQGLFSLWVVQFWGDFSWLSQPMPAVVFPVICAIVLLALAGAAAAALARRAPRPPLFAAATAIAIVVVLIHALEAYYYRSTGTTILEGRSFLEILPPLAIVLAAWTLLAPERQRGVAAAGVLAAAAALNLLGLGVLLQAFFF
jgi:hypothetical protein